MINALGSMNIYQVLLLTLVLFLAMTRNVEPSNRSSASSCGNIHNINDPFRLKSNPKKWGVSIYNLACENNRTVVYLFGGRYYVQSINYDSGHIRVVEDGLQKDNCSSLPRYSLLSSRRYRDYLQSHSDVAYNENTLVIVNCSKPVSSPSYITTSPCIEAPYSPNTSSYWNLYALVDQQVSDVWDFCTIHSWTWVSSDFWAEGLINSGSSNYGRIHDIMANGFRLNFYQSSGIKAFLCFFDFFSVYGGFTGCGSDYYSKHRPH
ncbi:uncharacterized protein LOC120289487 [Eucalyptus grandis]|uniref:uncharacterized protein LOC120289487 n=1 Tax=Eucalyptus grandis TaxID=71139 RepID=UPI00192EE1F7|nr:uncharacterized protein LOC120289487 [Eucalyptus grandis]